MSQRMDGLRLMVIGASSGIGAAVAERLASEGADVCVADISLQGAERIAGRIRENGGRAMAVACDVSDENSVNNAVAACVADLGGLDGVHVNAADMSALLKDGDALEVPLDVFDRTIAVNLRGHLLATRAALPHLLKNGAGAIVYTTSDSAFIGEGTRASYGASKSGLCALMRHVASRWGKEGISANCVAPGFVVTPEMAERGVTGGYEEYALSKTPSTRIGKVEDIAAMVALLLSREGRWMNGQVYSVNGGALMR